MTRAAEAAHATFAASAMAAGTVAAQSPLLIAHPAAPASPPVRPSGMPLARAPRPRWTGCGGGVLLAIGQSLSLAAESKVVLSIMAVPSALDRWIRIFRN